MFRRIWRAFVRFAFRQFYTTFAFTYDFVSMIVSRGQWRTWTRAAMPYIVGARVLELPCGTGNLLIDMCDAGYNVIGVDLSPAMLTITQNKLRRTNVNVPLVQARAQALPLASAVFDSITMTFPPEFVYDPQALAEMRRVLRDGGRLIWVDGGRLLPCDWYSRLLNTSLDAVGGTGTSFARELLEQTGFQVTIESARNAASQVTVILAAKRVSDE